MSEPDVAASRRRATRILFAASVFVVPMPFFILFDLGLVPLAFTVIWFLRPFLALGPFKAQTFDALAFAVPFLALHVAIVGGLLYLVAMLLCRLFFWLGSPRVAKLVVGVLVATGIAASAFPIYTVTDPNSSGANPRLDVVNAAGAWREFVLEERAPTPPQVHPVPWWPPRNGTP